MSKTIKEERLRTWNRYYNNLEHYGLNGKTSTEMLDLIKERVPKEVR